MVIMAKREAVSVSLTSSCVQMTDRVYSAAKDPATKAATFNHLRPRLGYQVSRPGS